MHIKMPLKLSSMVAFRLTDSIDDTQKFEELTAFIDDLDEGMLVVLEEQRSTALAQELAPRLFAAVMPFDSHASLASLLACAQIEISKIENKSGKSAKPSAQFSARLFTSASRPPALRQRLIDELSTYRIPFENSTTVDAHAILKFSAKLPSCSIEKWNKEICPPISDKALALVPHFGSFDESGRYRPHISLPAQKQNNRHAVPSAAKSQPDTAFELKSDQILIMDLAPYPLEAHGVSIGIQSMHGADELLFFVFDLGCHIGVFYAFPDTDPIRKVAPTLVDFCVLHLKREIMKRSALLGKDFVSQSYEDIVFGFGNSNNKQSSSHKETKKMIIDAASQRISKEFPRRSSSRIEWEGSSALIWLKNNNNVTAMKVGCDPLPAIYRIAAENPDMDERIRKFILLKRTACDFFLVAPSKMMIRRNLNDLDLFSPLEADHITIWAFDPKTANLFYLHEPYVGADEKKRFNPIEILKFMLANRDKAKIFLNYVEKDNKSILGLLNSLSGVMKKIRPSTDVEQVNLITEYQDNKRMARFSLTRNSEHSTIAVDYLDSETANSILNDTWKSVKSLET